MSPLIHLKIKIQRCLSSNSQSCPFQQFQTLVAPWALACISPHQLSTHYFIKISQTSTRVYITVCIGKCFLFNNVKQTDYIFVYYKYVITDDVTACKVQKSPTRDEVEWRDCCSLHAVTSFVIYYITHTHTENVIYLFYTIKIQMVY